jgi:excisionase family DNA binding protein
VRYLTVAELAEICRVTRATIRAWAWEGIVPCVRANRGRLLFDQAEVEAALKARRPQRTPEPVAHW